MIAAVSAASPYLMGNSINLYLIQDSSYIGMISTACLIIILTPILRLLANIHIQKISSKTRLILKNNLITHLSTNNPSIKRNNGEIIDLIDGDVDSSLYLNHGIFFDISLNSSLIILSLLITAYYYPLMTLAPLSGIVYALIAFYITHKSSDILYAKYVTENTKIIGTICNFLAQSKFYSDKTRIDIKNIERLAFRSRLKSSILESLSGTCYVLAIGVLLLTVIHALSQNMMSTGAIFASAIYVERVLNPTTALISIYFSNREAFYRRKRINAHEL